MPVNFQILCAHKCQTNHRMIRIYIQVSTSFSSTFTQTIFMYICLLIYAFAHDFIIYSYNMLCTCAHVYRFILLYINWCILPVCVYRCVSVCPVCFHFVVFIPHIQSHIRFISSSHSFLSLFFEMKFTLVCIIVILPLVIIYYCIMYMLVVVGATKEIKNEMGKKWRQRDLRYKHTIVINLHCLVCNYGRTCLCKLSVRLFIASSEWMNVCKCFLRCSRKFTDHH